MFFSCSLSNVQDIAVHWTEPRSGKDLKKSLRLGKVILVILIKSKSKAKWSWSSWSSPSDSWCHPDQVFETWEGDLDRNGAGSYHDLDDDHPQQNSQVIANRIDHHQLQYNPNAKELKMWELMLFQKKSQAEHGLKNLQTQAWLVNWNAEVIRSTGLAQKPCNSQIPRECQSPPVKLTRRDMGREILPPKIFPPSLSHDLASLSFAKILRSICLILWQISRTILAHL